LGGLIEGRGVERDFGHAKAGEVRGDAGSALVLLLVWRGSRFGCPTIAARRRLRSIINAKSRRRNEYLHTAYNLFNMSLFSSR